MVGPGDFTFTTARDVIRHRDVPAGFAAVLSGHIYRHQVLTADLRGRPLRTPVLYPGVARAHVVRGDRRAQGIPARAPLQWRRDDARALRVPPPAREADAAEGVGR
jgi:hypothetical protein